MIKLIVSDIDGTLVEDGGNSLNPELFSVILKLKEQGIHFAAASGRHVTSIEYLFEPIRDKIFYLGDNGSYVGCYGRNLFINELDRTLVANLIRDMKALGLDILVDCADCVYVDSKNQEYIDWLSNGYHFNMKQVEDVRLVTEPVVKLAACRMTGVQELARPLIETYGKQLKVTLSGSQWVDVMCPDVNKGNAVRLLQESLFIRPEETLAFGDQMNDIEMMRQAYYSFAVANARPETIEAARFLADENIRDGALKIMKLFVTIP